MSETVYGVTLADLRTYADHLDPRMPEVGRHLYDGSCPWCRSDHKPATGHPAAHELAAALLDRLESAERALTALRDVVMHVYADTRQWDGEYLLTEAAWNAVAAVASPAPASTGDTP